MGKTKRITKVQDDYLDLVKRFPLRPLRSEAEYDRAMKIHFELLSRADAPGLSNGESDYLDALDQFVGTYEEKHYPIPRGTDPVEMLKFLMDQHGMNASDIGKLLGSGRGQASLILNRKRELSKANIRTLSKHFKVSADLFL